MSRAQSVPGWMAAPGEFSSTLKLVLSTAYRNDRRFDRAWEFRTSGDEHPDLMVEITHLEKRESGELLELPPPKDPPEEAVVADFRGVLGDLLVKARERGTEFDRSWTFRYPDSEHPDLMVEITRLAPAEKTSDDDG